jgi:hypothetical protein
LVPQTLQRLQAQLAVPSKSIVTTTALSPVDNATKVRKSQVRAVIVAAAFGIFGTLLAVAGIDRLLNRRVARRARAPRPYPDNAAEPSVYQEPVTVLVPTRGSEQ